MTLYSFVHTSLYMVAALQGLNLFINTSAFARIVSAWALATSIGALILIAR